MPHRHRPLSGARPSATPVRGYTSTEYSDWHTTPRNARTPTGGDRLSKRGPAFLGPVCQSWYCVLVYPRTAVALGRARVLPLRRHFSRTGPAAGCREPQAAGDASPEIGVDLGQVLVDRALLDEALHPVTQRPDDVLDQMVLIGRRHHVPVQRTGLDEVVVVFVRHVGR